MADPDNPAAEAAERFIQAVGREREEVLDTIDAVANNQQALEALQKALKFSEGTSLAIMEARDEVVGRIWKAEEMTAAAMADRISITPQRVGQIIKAHRHKEASP